jgi:hypothetical protein
MYAWNVPWSACPKTRMFVWFVFPVNSIGNQRPAAAIVIETMCQQQRDTEMICLNDSAC